MANYKIERASEDIKREISYLILHEVKDPRVSGLLSITGVDLSKDYKYAKVYVSLFGDSENKEDSFKALKSAEGFLSHEVSKRIKLRFTPKITFHVDDSMDRAIKIENLIERIHKGNTNDNE